MVAILRRLLQMIFDILSKGQVESVCADLQDNLLPYPYYETTHTEDGITWTDNGDGTVTANGVSSASSVFNLTSNFNSTLVLPKGKYIVSGCPSGYNKQCRIRVGIGADSVFVGQDWESGIEFELQEETIVSLLLEVLRAGTTVTNAVFKPMLIRGSVAPKNYKAYSSGNAGLQKQINVLANVDSNLQKQIDNLANKDTNLQSQISSLTFKSAGLQSQVDNLVSTVQITFNADNALKEDIFPPEGFTTGNCFIAGFVHTTASGGKYCNCINTDNNVLVVPKILAYDDCWSLWKTGIVGGTGSFSATGTLTLYLVRC